MSLYESLDQFVGAGILASAPAIGSKIPVGSAVNGDRLAAYLRENEVGAIGPLLDALAQDVWLAQDSRGIPYRVSVEHALLLTSVLAEFPPRPEEIASALELRRQASASPNDSTAQAQRIADDIAQRAKDAGVLGAPGILVHVIDFLLERLFARLLDDPALLPSLAQPIADFLARSENTMPMDALPNSNRGTRAGSPKVHAASPRQTAINVQPLMKPQQAPMSFPGFATGAATALALPEPHEVDDPVPQAVPVAEESTAIEPRIIALFEGRGEAAVLDDIRIRYGLTTRALARFIGLLAAEGVVPERLLTRLEDLAAWLKTTREQLLKTSNESAEARRLKSRAAALLADGDLEQAAEVMKQIRRNVRDDRRKIEGRLEDEISALKLQMVEEAKATARLAELAMARFDFDSAAELFAEAADCIPQGDSEGQWRYATRQAEALARKGEERGDEIALTEAGKVYQRAARQAADARSAVGEAIAHAGLANTMCLLAAKEKSTDRIKEAIVVYKKALSAFAPTEESRRRAITYMQLGTALHIIADRDGEAGAAHEAAGAFREALNGLSREAAPLDWAMAQLGLANALVALEEKEKRPELLAQAVTAYREALKDLTRDRNSLEWGKLHMNLGNALHGLGEAEGSPSRLEEAVAAHREALKVFTRDSNADRWSQCMMYLGNALASLGAREAGTTLGYEEAVKAYDESLQVLSREETPVPWAITKMNLGSVLIRLGERTKMRSYWLSAASAMIPALEVFEREGATEYAEMTRANLRRFHDKWDDVITPAPAGA